MRNKFSKLALTVSLVLTLALTLSCSGDGGGNDQPSANSGTEISSSSTQSSGSEEGSVKKDKISGFSQKGPFMKGSTAVLYELDDKLVQTGRSFRDIIADDRGSFDIKINVELVSPYAMLEADGYYRNEVTGKPSTGTIKLYAIADIREKSNVNVNILTHLEYYRVQKLVEDGKSLKDAKKQAQEEILAVFGISGSFENSEDMSIFGTTDGDAALLAISVLLQGSLSEGQFVERLTDFRLGFRETGAWDSKTAKDAMADWATKTSLGSIRSNILGWNLSSAVPDFEKFVNNYRYANYGLGVCDDSLQNSIKKSNRGVDYICKSNAWAVATEYERDTYQWVCTEGEIKDGQASGKKYVCKYEIWRIANYKDIVCFEEKNCNYFTDARDNKRYAYVMIGEQTWMAENLNYNATSSICYDNDPANCDKYGRLYNWVTAMGIDAKYEAEKWSGSNVKHEGICPTGWHLPSNEEWQELVDFAGGNVTAEKKLKAASGWRGSNFENESGNGTDDYGFSALPAGGNGGFVFSVYLVGYGGHWWSSSELDASDAYCRSMNHYGEGAYYSRNGKSSLFSVRCLQD